MAYKSSKSKSVSPLDPGCKKTIYNSREEAEDMIRHIQEPDSLPLVENLTHVFGCKDELPRAAGRICRIDRQKAPGTGAQ